jgi:hypothetical protein
VAYLKNQKPNGKEKQMMREILKYEDRNVMSALLLRDFLHHF